MIDETKVASCVLNNIDTDDKLSWDVEFEGFSDHGEKTMAANGRPAYCAYSTMTDQFRPKNQDEIDQYADNEGKVMTINELDPVKNRLDNENIQKFMSDFDYSFVLK